MDDTTVYIPKDGAACLWGSNGQCMALRKAIKMNVLDDAINKIGKEYIEYGRKEMLYGSNDYLKGVLDGLQTSLQTLHELRGDKEGQNEER